VATPDLLVPAVLLASARGGAGIDPQEQSTGHGPLAVTPLLNGGPYVFPVAAPIAVGDSYGAPRSGIVWHHGDDLFAPLGTPVVAVADGVITLVGWQKRGGWRLWLRDRARNTYYYAHLSGYTAVVHKRAHVKAGQVLGFVGSTGDAISTPYHLHFEIHPRRFLSLHYDGAVDPTSYLLRWKRVEVKGKPLPVLNPPGGPPAADQREMARLELLAVRQGGGNAEAELVRLLKGHPRAAALTRRASSEEPDTRATTPGEKRSRLGIALAIVGGVFALALLPPAVLITRRRFFAPAVAVEEPE
jgi:hypothetical protein